MIATVESTPLTGIIWVDESKIVEGTVTIVPSPTSDGYTFSLQGHGEDWNVSESVDQEWIVNLDPGDVLYRLTFQFPNGAHFSFMAAELESQKTPGAFIVQEVPSGSASMLLSFLNNVSKEGGQAYNLGFKFLDPNGNPVTWDPTIAFNPPG